MHWVFLGLTTHIVLKTFAMHLPLDECISDD